MLRSLTPKPMSSCSKASRGLFVLRWVGRIFTAISISPGLGLRECSSRYAFPAGRNLPGKGLRYLWTLIVKAAVHRSFGSWPRKLEARNLKLELKLDARSWNYPTSSFQRLFQPQASSVQPPSPIPLTYRHWAGVSPYTSSYELSRDLCF